MSNINTIPSTRLVFTDSAVEDAASPAAGTVPDAQAIALAPTQEGVEGIRSGLARHTGIYSLHIVSHASPGFLRQSAMRAPVLSKNMQVICNSRPQPSHLMPASLQIEDPLYVPPLRPDSRGAGHPRYCHSREFSCRDAIYGVSSRINPVSSRIARVSSRIYRVSFLCHKDAG